MRSVFHQSFATSGVLRHRLVFVETLSLELFLREDVSRCKALLLRSLPGFDLRLIRLILDTVFCSSPGPLVNFRLRTNVDVRFDSLDFVHSA